MNKSKNAIFMLALILSIPVIFSYREKVSLEELKRFAATEKYPDDVFLDTVSNKRALIIVAHDDDDCAMSGTIAKLTAQGWTIKQLSLQSHPNKKGVNPAGIICAGNELILEDGLYRIGLDTMKLPYMPIPYEQIQSQFLTEKVSKELIAKIEAFKPSVVFTLDDQKGGYGHPEHIFISRLVKELFELGKINIQRIYQSVYTDHMEREIVEKWLGAKLKAWGQPDPSQLANALYGITGMPEPSVQVNIRVASKQKMNYLRTYGEEVRKNLRKFIPYYEDFDAETYFGIFDREFFRVIGN